LKHADEDWLMTYRTKFWLWGGLSLAGTIVAGTVFGKLIPLGGGSPQPHLVFPLMLLLYGLVLGVVWLWWKRTDDLQQQGQLVSWYWGGSTGALAMLIYVMTFFGRESPITVGATYMLGAQIAGFVLVWLVWLARGRGQAE
jgi:hypothetical protein